MTHELATLHELDAQIDARRAQLGKLRDELEALRAEGVVFLMRRITPEREQIVAYLQDAAFRWRTSSGIHAAVSDLAIEILRGAHVQASDAGELDDLLAKIRRTR